MTMIKPVPTHDDLVQASNDIKEAQLSLQALVKAIYPVGTQLSVRLALSQIRVRVTGHNGAYWSGAGMLHGVNIKTGKTRRFHFRDIVREGGSDA